jgi:conjugative relaxase-like TrwC/TraI family protein
MMTLSKALTAGQAQKYYEAEYTNARESYYSEADSIDGEWFGELATEWGLEGAVDKEAFARLTEGQDPLTGEQLIRRVTVKEYENQYGEKVKNSEHRAGYDATFSAPKSVSLAALVGDDNRIREAHRNAVKTAMGELWRITSRRELEARLPHRRRAILPLRCLSMIQRVQIKKLAMPLLNSIRTQSSLTLPA